MLLSMTELWVEYSSYLHKIKWQAWLQSRHITNETSIMSISVSFGNTVLGTVVTNQTAYSIAQSVQYR